MKKMRRADPYIIAFGLYLLLTASAISAADAAVNMEAVKAIVYETLAVVGVVTIGAAGGLIAWILARDRDLQGKRFDRIEAGLNEMFGGLQQAIRALQDHNDCPTAHPAASAHNHVPMNEKMDSIESKLDALIVEHRIIRDTESCIAKSINRDPKDSPYPRRHDDPPGYNGTGRRGKP